MSAPVILWLRQDLRLKDHPALRAAASAGRPLIPVYILDDETPGSWVAGGAGRWWLHRSLTRLGKSLEAMGSRLVLRRGRTDQVLMELVRETGASELYWSRGYEPWMRSLEEKLHAELSKSGVTCHRYPGSLLFEPDRVKTKQGGPFRVYTPFSKACFATGVDASRQKEMERLPSVPGDTASDSLEEWSLLPAQPDWAAGFTDYWTPGERGAAEALSQFIDKALRNYAEDRDRPDRIGTSRLSPHLHFGEISPRTCWHAVRMAEADQRIQERDAGSFLRELLWREFSHHLLFHWPDLPEAPFRDEFAAFPWEDDEATLKAWQRGRTGFPIVDAGMRELWHTGWMHNRVRMIAASFLIKHLRIHWRRGEEWFWDTLVDADLANNAAGWQWVAGCGADAAPYFRIFNPMLQGSKFDPDGGYVRQWVPELSRMPAKHIHTPWDAPEAILAEAGVALGETYPLPIVDHAEARQAALAAFQTIRRGS